MMALVVLRHYSPSFVMNTAGLKNEISRVAPAHSRASTGSHVKLQDPARSIAKFRLEWLGNRPAANGCTCLRSARAQICEAKAAQTGDPPSRWQKRALAAMSAQAKKTGGPLKPLDTEAVAKRQRLQ
jgi:hypothetical protein